MNIRKNAAIRIAFLSACLFSACVHAAEPVLVKDINPGPGDSAPHGFAAINHTLYFAADDPDVGFDGGALFKTDGTAAGTVMLVPGEELAFGGNLTAFGDALFYVNSFVDVGAVLHRYDTLTGDIVVLSGNPVDPTDPVQPGEFFVLDEKLYFSGFQYVTGGGLWTTDGTPEGTLLVKGVYPNSKFVLVGNSVYFKGHDNTVPASEAGLWKSDGTSDGTVLVKSFDPASVEIDSLTVVGEKIYFSARPIPHNCSSNEELWVSDGTTDGTVMIKEFTGPFCSFEPNALVALGDTLYFFASDELHGEELWKSDGTTESTVLVKDIVPGPTSGVLSGDQSLPYTVGNTVYFSARFFDANFGTDLGELWKSDGTNAGTVRVGSTSFVFGSIGFLNHIGNTLYFAAADLVHGLELWKTNGTANGTKQVKDINAGPDDGLIGQGQQYLLPEYTRQNKVIVAGEVLYFVANDGVHGNELWKLDTEKVLVPSENPILNGALLLLLDEED